MAKHTGPSGVLGEGLTPKERAFVTEYLVDLNGTKAAIRAGYSPKRAKAQASIMLDIPRVHDALTIEFQKRLVRTQSVGDEVLQEIKRIAMVSIADIASWSTKKGKSKLHIVDSAKLHPMLARCIKRITCRDGEVSVELYDKAQMLGLLAKHYGLGDLERDATARVDSQSYRVTFKRTEEVTVTAPPAPAPEPSVDAGKLA